VRDSEALKEVLSGKADFKDAFEKRDVYWFGPEAFDLRVSKIRVRQEKMSSADGTEKSRCLVTYKAKEEYHGIEINDELEFEAEPAEVFEAFLKTAGLKPGAGKIKRGWAFVKENITAELVEVEGLGWFIELEILLSDKNKSEETIAKAKETLLAFLDSLGIEREAIEGRYYLDLLSAANQGTYDI